MGELDHYDLSILVDGALARAQILSKFYKTTFRLSLEILAPHSLAQAALALLLQLFVVLLDVVEDGARARAARVHLLKWFNIDSKF